VTDAEGIPKRCAASLLFIGRAGAACMPESRRERNRLDMNADLLGALLSVPVLGCLAACVGTALHRFWKGENFLPESPARKNRTDVRGALLAGLGCFVFAAALAVVWAALGGAGNGTPLNEAFASRFDHTIDTNSYLGLAQYGYGNGEAFREQYLMIVFFPMFPWIVRLVRLCMGAGLFSVATLIQPFFFGMAGGLLYALVQRRFGRSAAAWTVAYLLCMPQSFFFAVPMTESIFLAFSLAAFWMLETDRPVGFALFGFLAALTRSPGFLLSGAAGVAWLMHLRTTAQTYPTAQKSSGGWLKSLRWRDHRWLAAAFGPAAGLGVYLLMNKAVYGAWFAFSVFQKEHWSQGPGFIWNTLQTHSYYVLTRAASGDSFTLYVSLLTLIYIPAKALLLFLQRKKLPLPWLAHAVAYICMTDGATWLLSEARYTLCLPVIPLCLALCCKSRAAKWIALGGLAAIWGIYMAVFCIGGPIY
jgi:hypothetical protein